MERDRRLQKICQSKYSRHAGLDWAVAAVVGVDVAVAALHMLGMLDWIR